MLKIVVTGSTGFVGRNLLKIPGAVGLSRKDIPEWTPQTDFRPFLKDAAVVIHAAGIAHGRENDPQKVFGFHVDVTRKLLQDAHDIGCTRFILISSASVYGRAKDARPIPEVQAPDPTDDYGRSKWMAEVAVQDFCRSHPSIQYTILRPPMIYGPDAPGSPAKVRALAKKGIPLPLGGLKSPRSILHVDDLVDFVKVHLLNTSDSRGMNQVLNLAAIKPLPVGEIVRKLAADGNKKPNVFDFPEAFFRPLFWMLRVLKPGSRIPQQLIEPFVLDTTKSQGFGFHRS
ncbi:MAG: NAD-dependent epimerase/dehydratase family protein [Bdellovibrionales bacterium]|nr:NAD-dependent epimerase/dehydratase family protein [Bdellovibrionales bacterium]